MQQNAFIFTTLIIMTFGCKQSVQVPKKDIKKSDKSVLVKHKTYSVLNPYASEKITLWEDYDEFSLFLKRFEETTPLEAFDNSTELKTLIKALKDSLPITELKIPAFKARLNVLENEVLRLYDMSLIPAITPAEVNKQIDKVFLVYGSLNDKINTFYQKKKFDDDVNLDNFFLLDSTNNQRGKEHQSPSLNTTQSDLKNSKLKRQFLRKNSVQKLNKQHENQ